MRKDPTVLEPYRIDMYHGITIVTPLTTHVTVNSPVGCPADRSGSKKGHSRVTVTRLSGVRPYVSRGRVIETSSGSKDANETTVVLGVSILITVTISAHHPTVVCTASVAGELGNPFVVTKAIVEHPFKKDCVPVILTPNVGLITGVSTVLASTFLSVSHPKSTGAGNGRETVPTATGVSGPTRTGSRTPTHKKF